MRLDAEKKTVFKSMILKWYRPDFGGKDQAVFEWLKAHVGDE